MGSILDSDMSKGLGQLLREKRVRIPYYQRSYAWKRSQVEELYRDFERAIDESKDYYFVGSVVGCQSKPQENEIEIVDGQQRLATTAILLAAIRDHLINPLKETEQATRFEENYLIREDGFVDQTRHPTLQLNEIDNDYYKDNILARVKPTLRRSELRPPSHRLLFDAANIAAAQVKMIVGTRKPADQKRELQKWVTFIEKKARIVFIVVEDAADAFMIFETLNDRGLDLTVADLTKNYLFMKVGKSQVETAKNYWARMGATLSASSDADVTKVYIHHLWSSFHGVTRDKELFRDMRNKYDDPGKAMAFTKLLCDTSPVYAALGNSDSDFWNDYGRHAKRHLGILNSSLKATQVRMLLLAVVAKFTHRDVEKILTCAVWWSVRFLIAGGSPSRWESFYATYAKAIRDGSIKNADQLIDRIASDVPGDGAFQSAFSEATVNKAVGRYFLNCLEATLLGDQAPHLAPDDPKLLDREHIMPDHPDYKKWPTLSREDHERLVDRIGNFTLLTPEENGIERKNGSFKEAQKIYKRSGVKLTQEIGDHRGEWDETAINERQQRLAKLAVSIWKLRPDKKTTKKNAVNKKAAPKKSAKKR